MKRRFIITACVFGAIAVIAGAFGAHGLEGKLSVKNMEVWHTAVQYQFYHTFALLFLSTLTRFKMRLIGHCYYMFVIGMVLFCGSLYLLACEQVLDWSWIPAVGPITPIGGVLFIAGWITLGIAALKIK